MVDRAGRLLTPSLGRFDVEVDGLRLRGNHVGQLYYVRELLESDREATFVRILKQSIRPGATVVEAGAHIGYLTLQCARAVGESGRVFAFEANPHTAPVVARNLALNGLDGRCEVVPLALADVPGRRSFYLGGGGDTSSLYEPGEGAEPIEVEVTTLDAWLDPAVAVDVIKLDIEGGEPAALHGMRETIRRAAPNLVVFAECNPELLERAGSSPADLLATLRDLGLETNWIDEDRKETRPLDELGSWAGYVNLYCRRI